MQHYKKIIKDWGKFTLGQNVHRKNNALHDVFIRLMQEPEIVQINKTMYKKFSEDFD